MIRRLATRSLLLAALLLAAPAWVWPEALDLPTPRLTIPTPAPPPESPPCPEGDPQSCQPEWRLLTTTTSAPTRLELVRQLGMLHQVAASLRQADHPWEVAQLLAEGLPLLSQWLGREHPLLVELRLQQAEALQAAGGDPAPLLNELEPLFSRQPETTRLRQLRLLQLQAPDDTPSAAYLELLGELWDGHHPALAAPLAAWGRARLAAGDEAAGDEALEQALALLTTYQGPYHASRLRLLQEGAALCQRRDHPDNAALRLRGAIALVENLWSREHPALIPLLSTLAELQIGSNKPFLAEKTLGRLLVLATRQLGPHHRQTGLILAQLAHTHQLQGNLTTALRIWRHAGSILAEHWRDHPADRLRVVAGVARCLADTGDVAAEEGHLRQALPELAAHMTPNDPALAQLRERQGQLASQLNPAGFPPQEWPLATKKQELQARLAAHGATGEQAMAQFAAALGVTLSTPPTGKELTQLLRHLPPTAHAPAAQPE